MKPARIAIAALIASALCSVTAAQPYPAKPIRLIVPATPGGGSDVPARIVTQALTDDLGWKFVVDNRGGASGRIGAEIAARSAPDGYTLLVANTTPNAVVQGAASNLPYDTLRDFVPISLFATSDFNLVVHPSVPATNVKELVALARAKPGEIRFGSVGNISGAHVTGELFKQLAGINIVHVPYKGAAPAMVALISGEIQMYFGSGPSVAPHVKSGKVRVLATTGTKRSRFSPDLPTVGETVPGHEGRLWYGMAAPAGTPKEIIATLHKAIVTSGSSPRVIDQLAAVGMDSVTNSPAEFSAFIGAEIVKWGKVVKASGTPLE
ncbi:MAG TPA: tripartite tricarboxylate transporter substrate binding protein [Burkholderiales bacterium]|nr:tripartite tricarboxylate transporter substrate binding protein [Burkholderiales bacterium]